MALVTLKYALKLSSAYGYLADEDFEKSYSLLSEYYEILREEKTQRSQFFFLDMLMSETSLKTNRLEQSREKAVSAKHKIERNSRLNDQEKLYLSAYCNSLLRAGGHEDDEPDIDYRKSDWSQVRKKFFKRFPLKIPGKIPGLKY